MKLKILSHLGIVLLVASCGQDLPPDVAQAYANLPEKIDYNFHIKPILSDRCYACHGPDTASRKAKLRLDLRDAALKHESDGVRVIVPGDPDASLLITVLSLDPLHQTAMPPAPDKIWGIRLEILRKWQSSINLRLLPLLKRNQKYVELGGQVLWKNDLLPH